MMKYARFRIVCLLAVVAAVGGLFSHVADAQQYNRFGPANGILKGVTTSPQTTAATGSDITALFSGTCNAAAFLRGNAACFDLFGSANTWSNTQTFSSNGTNASFTGADPRFNLNETDQGVDNKNWLMRSVNGSLSFSTATDAAPFGAVNDALAIGRSGTAIGRITLNGSGSSVVQTGTSSLAGSIVGLEISPQALVNSTNPSLYIYDSDATANSRMYRFGTPGADQLAFQLRSDDNTTGASWLTVDRSGNTATAISLTGTAINLNGVAASDFARLSQSNTFTGNTQTISNTSGPRLVLRDSDATADEQCFFTFSQSSIYSLWASTDANCSSTTGATEVYRVTRTGATVNDFLFQAGTSRWLTSSSPQAVFSPTNANITSRSAGTTVVAAVQVNGSAATESTQSWTRANGANGSGPILYLNKSRGSISAPTTIVASGDDIGKITFSGSDGAAFSNGAEIVAQVDGTPGANDMPGRLVFSTTLDGANTPTERLRIANNGAWGLAGANFGTSGQILTSNGSGAAPTWQGAPAGATGANPTASVGLSAVNGVATTFLRSDGAPALSQSITPTWTGAHSFTAPTTFSTGATAQAALINSTAASGPYITFQRSGVSTGDVGNGGSMGAGFTTDSLALAARAGNAIQFGVSGNANPSFTIEPDGSWNVGGNGTSGQVLTSNGAASAPTWQAVPATAASGASATAGGSTSLPSAGTLTAIALSTEDFDTGNFHDNVTNNSRVILPSSTGYASCSGSISITGGNTTANTYFDYNLYLRKNGTDYLAVSRDNWLAVTAGSSVNGKLSVSMAMIPANGTDYVEMVAAQNGGTTNGSVIANSTTSTAATTRLTCSAQ